ncbi:MAG TPA: hypothetical protein V6C72_13580, partial [Chroococcales cyanobacterium]
GAYEDKFFAYFEDTDICVRASAARWKLILVPSSTVWHKVSRSTGGHESPLQQYYGTRSRLLFMQRHLSTAKFTAFWLLSLPRPCCAACSPASSSPTVTAMRDFGHASMDCGISLADTLVNLRLGRRRSNRDPAKFQISVLASGLLATIKQFAETLIIKTPIRLPGACV